MKQNNFTQQTHFIGVLLSGCDAGIKGVVNNVSWIMYTVYW